MQKKESKISVSLIAMFVVVALIIAMAFLTNAETVQQTAWSLVPPIIAIALALITKEVYSSLFIGSRQPGHWYLRSSPSRWH